MAGRQYAAWAAGSPALRTRLAAIGEKFQASASPRTAMHTGHGRHRRSDSNRIVIGTAANRSRAMFSPTGDDTANVTVQAARYATNVQRRMRAAPTFHVSPIPIRQNAVAARNSATENGNVPPPG